MNEELKRQLNKTIEEFFERKNAQYEKVFELAVHTAMIQGEATIRCSPMGELEVVNPFKGCECGAMTFQAGSEE